MIARLAFLAPLLLAAVVALAPGRARACSCMQQDPGTAFEQAASVFEGRVASIEPGDGEVLVTLGVVRTWKGADSEEVQVRTNESSAACGYNFEQGKSYLVYTHDVDGAEHVSLCSRTALIEDAGEDLAAMGEGVTPVSPHEPTETVEPTPAPATQATTYEAGCASCAVGTERNEGAAWLGSALVLFAAFLRRRR